MINGLAIVPARAGSRRLKDKNLKLLDGKELFFHTADLAAEMFKCVILTTDSEELLEKSRERYKNKENVAVKKRPKYLCTDYSKVLETVKFYTEDVYTSEKKFISSVYLLLPTCPLRTKEDILSVKEILSSGTVDSVVSVTDYEFPPTLCLQDDGHGALVSPFNPNPFISGNTRSQDHPKFFRPNGAVYGSRFGSFIKHKNFFSGRVKYHYMPRERSVDIDNEIDLQLAELIIQRSKSGREN